MSDHNVLPDIVQRYLDAYNRRDVAALVECVSESVVFENVSNASASTRIEGRVAFAHLAAQAAEIFTVRRQVVRTAVIAAHRVALEIDWTGTPAIDVGELKAGQPVHLRGASFLTIEDGKLSNIVDLS